MLARPAAIKLIRPEVLGAGNQRGGELALQRFQREAQAAALLRSPHTISLYDFGVTDEGTFYYVMELLDGFDLDTLVKSLGPVPPAARSSSCVRPATRWARRTEGAHPPRHQALEHLHLPLGEVDFIKVLDFGLVKHQGDCGARADGSTQPNVTTGTPAYMAPEMALGEAVDRSVDIYALGCVGYWLLTGRLVFEGVTAMEYAGGAHEPRAPSRPSGGTTPSPTSAGPRRG